MRRAVALVTAVMVLVVGGAALLVAESRARVETVRTEIEAAASQQPGSEYFVDLMDTPAFVRRAVTESLVNDAVPRVDLVPRDGYIAITFGAFRGGNEVVTLTRPWAPRLVTTPIAIGLVLAITGMLVAASRYRPRPAGRSSWDAERGHRGHPAAS
ncbi:hypothetical protein [Labedella endophytica]|uniref:Uncharacterized protein n=1 Tax=Labedella endophytica TaxID=1523160 RepID=A0A3S0X8C9_9MICO|nr:hypothetical protein [Labedella endophytica]RUR01778.1 hypothetical protein ELQ94_10005 [Labedella endophytica]